jgi:hypothetical protein
MKIRKFLLLLLLARTLAAVEGQWLIQAVAVSEAPQIDGRLAEPCYSQPPAATDFVQFHPLNGAKAAFATEVYVCFDAHNLYIAFRCHDPEPEKIRADVTPFAGYVNNDEVAVMLDAFADSRTYVTFNVNPRGTVRVRIRSGKQPPASMKTAGAPKSRSLSNRCASRCVTSRSGGSISAAVSFASTKRIIGRR